jgi:tRNA A37 threonylcarbamoyltransferase TsaD
MTLRARLGLGYPGGPIIDRLAQQGNDRAVALPRTRLTHADRNAPHLPGHRDFSFSGLKTSVLRHVMSRKDALGLASEDPLPDDDVIHICASFQRVVVETLVERLFDTAATLGARSAGIAGGVSANSRLRREAAEGARRTGIPLFVPDMALSTDNAAMIAAAGLRRYRAGVRADLDLNADASLAL